MIALLLMAFQHETHQAIIKRTETVEYPSGLAYIAIKKLRERACPTDEMTDSRLQKEVDKCKFGRYDNPQVLDDKLTAVELLYRASGRRLDEQRKLTVLINSLHEEYTFCLTTANMRAQMKGETTASYDELYNECKARFAALTVAVPEKYKMVSAMDERKDKPKEIGLNALPFKGKCDKCGKIGHKKADCRSGNGGEESNNKPKFNGTCNRCNRKGHKEANCWEDPANASKRPKGYTPGGSKDDKKEVAAPNVEVVMNSFDFAFEDEMCRELFLVGSGVLIDAGRDAGPSHEYQNLASDSEDERTTDTTTI